MKNITMSTIILILTATTVALTAGLFFAWSCSIIPGLGAMPDKVYVTTMQSINKAILNPVFFAAFMGALVLLPLSTYLHYEQPLTQRFWLLLGATIFYAVGVFGITAFGNVPLNEALSAFNSSSATESAIKQAREQFEVPWNNLHTIRTICSVLVVVLVTMACLSPVKAAVSLLSE